MIICTDLYISKLITYTELYNYLIQGNNLHFVFEDYFYKYNDELKIYHKIKNDGYSNVGVRVSKEEVLRSIKIFLRRAKIEKLKNKICKISQ
jgi:hypothetical protein